MSDVIELIADKEKICGVQININEAKSAYFQISFHYLLELICGELFKVITKL